MIGLAAIVNPVVPSCVRVASLPAPMLITALSVRRNTSSPNTASKTTLNPPSVCRDPSVVDVALVVSSVLTTPDATMVLVVKAAVATVPPAAVSVFDEWVSVMSPLLKLMTPPLATNRSDHIRDVVPRATPALVTGDRAFSTSSTSLTLLTLRIILLSVVAKSTRFCESLPNFRDVL